MAIAVPSALPGFPSHQRAAAPMVKLQMLIIRVAAIGFRSLSGDRVAFGVDTPQQNVFTGLFMSALSAVVALFSAIALYAAYLGTDQAKWSIYLPAAFCLCIARWQASSFVVGLKLRRKLNRARAGLEINSQLKQAMGSPTLPPADMSNSSKRKALPSTRLNYCSLWIVLKGNGSQSSRG
jgi:hypothetical protein